MSHEIKGGLCPPFIFPLQDRAMTRVLTCTLLLTVSPIVLSVTDEELRLCREIGDPDLRLACYDDLSSIQPPNTTVNATEIGANAQLVEPATQPAPPIKEPVSQTLQNVAEQTLGYEQVKSKPQNEPAKKSQQSELTGTVVDVIRAPFGEAIISLENGQIWREIENNKLRIQKGEEVNIKKSRWGPTYWLIDARQDRSRVRRVQ
jgi:hypothetical protein